MQITLPSICEAEEYICETMQLKNNPKNVNNQKMLESRAELFKNCTVLEGNLYIFLSTDPNMNHSDYMIYRFPRLREITGSLLVFQVSGIRNLGDLLPNLRIIRGQTLVHNYALVIYQNPDMEEIRLPLLQEISQGGVRITENPKLCFADTVNWVRLVREKGSHIYVKENGEPSKIFLLFVFQ